MFAGARRQARVPEIVDADSDDVVAAFESGGDVEGETGVTALVLADARAVHEQFSDLKDAVEFEINALAGPRFRHVEMFPVPAVTSVEAVRGEVGNRE